MIDPRFLRRLTIEAAKKEGLDTIDMILNAFLPKDYDTWAVVLPLGTGFEVYQEIYAAVFHHYDITELCMTFLEQWFFLDDYLEPLEVRWNKVHKYTDTETNRKYPPMILKDVTSEVAERWGAEEFPHEIHCEYE
jgi:hypothetical protein